MEELQVAYEQLLTDYTALQAEYDKLNVKEGETEVSDSSTDFILERDNGTMKYIKSELSTDYQGKDAVILYFNYTNTSGSSTNAAFSFMPKVFQNGIQCQTAIFLNPVPEITAASTEVQDGISIDVAYAYNIGDKSDLTVELNELISFEKPITATISIE